MFERSESLEAAKPRALPRRAAAVGLLTTDGEFWIVMAERPTTGLDDIDRAARPLESPMSICHEVLADGQLRIGAVDPRRAPLLSEVLGEV